jgi:3'-phosphoadenosine 5'-phosphosulfate sulfotransferase (PAPS reductase)/FAD synthetase
MTYLARLIAAGAHPVVPELPGIAITPDIAEAIVNDAWIVFNLSGGKDSTAAMSAVNLFLDGLGHSRDRRMAVHADLGRAEWATTSATVDRIAAEAGVPLTVVRRSAGDLVDRWLQRFESGKRRYEALETYNLIGPWSSASLRFCQSEMKSAVIGPAIAQRLRGQTIVSVLGLRRDESHNRAAIPISKADHRHAKAGNRHGTAMMVWNPIADWTSGDVFRAHQILGLLLHAPLVPVLRLCLDARSISVSIGAGERGGLSRARRHRGSFDVPVPTGTVAGGCRAPPSGIGAAG